MALLGVVAADVSHLNNMYLPPHMAAFAHKHIEYAQQSQEIPQVEITQNTVEETEPEQQYYTGKIQIENVKFGPGYGGDIQFQAGGSVGGHVSGAGAATTTTTTTVTGSVPAPGSDSFTQQQAAYWTSVSQQQQEQEVHVPEKKYYTGLIVPSQTQEAAAVVEEQAVEQTEEQAVEQTEEQAVEQTEEQTQEQAQEPEQQYYTGLVYQPGQEQYEATSGVSVETSVPAVSAPVIPGSDDFTNQQAAYWSSQSQQQESAASSVIPGSDDFTNQQGAYYTSISTKQESAPALSVSVSSGVETQYGSNGGYVY